MPRTHQQLLPLVLILVTAALAACDRHDDSPNAHTNTDSHNHVSPVESKTQSVTPTNRVDIPSSVRQNLGVTFAKVELRNVAQTLRVPGNFELLPTARREYRTPLAGRVELLVAQFQSVEIGAELYRVEASVWRDLQEQILAVQAKVDSMGPLREAHRVHERSLADKVALWQDRLKQLDELRAAGGGGASQYTEARATLNATQAELADVMEKDAELLAEHKRADAELRSLVSRRDLLARSAAAPTPSDSHSTSDFTVRALAPGIVESLAITPGGLAAENTLILSVVQPDQIRFRARGLQSDLGRLQTGLPVRITPAQGASVSLQDAMTSTLTLGLTADPAERTIDLIAVPAHLATWARAGVSAHLEITLAGGTEELAIPLSAVVRDGATPIIFRRDPANPDKAIRMEADLGISDGRWVVIASGVKQGDEIVLGGNYQLMLATSGSASKGGHFHPDGTFHEGEH